jgi:glycolate oxidase iron-sulfur subunit
VQTKLPEAIVATSKGRRAEEILRSCVHCGFCNATCPTYELLGDELDGPRGRIYLIKEMLEAQKVESVTVTHLDRCLTCRACETTCPSGVEYSQLLEIARDYVSSNYRRDLLDRIKRLWLIRTVPYKRRFRRWAQLGRAMRWFLPKRLREMLPVAPAAAALQATPRVSPSVAASSVLLLNGCVQQVTTPQVNAALRELLAARGIAVVELAEEGCCGALELHLGKEIGALATMRNLLDNLAPLLDEVDAVISTASGCGITLKDYPRLLKDDATHGKLARRLGDKLLDVGEYLLSLDLSWRKQDEVLAVALHQPCTLQHGQKLGDEARQLLQNAGYDLVAVRDEHSCCGSAGTYSLLQAKLSSQLRDRKISCLESGQPDVIATSNVGCHTHLAVAASVPVVHWIELLR